MTWVEGNRILVGIASYKRPQCRTLETLREAGIDDVIVSTQTEADYREYKKRHNCEVIYAPKDSAAGNRNTILEYVDEPVLLLDDDITCFKLFRNGRWMKDTFSSLEAIFQTEAAARDNGCSLFGVSQTDNNIIMRNRFEYDFNVLLQGTVIGVLDTRIRFNEKYKMVEDYEICLREMRKGTRILRANYICAGKPKNGTNQGGMHERYEQGQLKHWIATLGKYYPEFRPNKNKDGGQLWRG